MAYLRSTDRWEKVWVCPLGHSTIDRKSTRLNSSHTVISYAVFCLKKKIERFTYSISCVVVIVFFFFCLLWNSQISTLFPYTTLFRSTASLMSVNCPRG